MAERRSGGIAFVLPAEEHECSEDRAKAKRPWTPVSTGVRRSNMVTVELTPHLYQFFPDLRGRRLDVEAANVAEVVREVDRIAPGLAFYLCDERGRLRRHVNIFVKDQMIADRQRLSDPVEPNSRVLILQALSGG